MQTLRDIAWFLAAKEPHYPEQQDDDDDAAECQNSQWLLLQASFPMTDDCLLLLVLGRLQPGFSPFFMAQSPRRLPADDKTSCQL